MLTPQSYPYGRPRLLFSLCIAMWQLGCETQSSDLGLHVPDRLIDGGVELIDAKPPTQFDVEVDLDVEIEVDMRIDLPLDMDGGVEVIDQGEVEAGNPIVSNGGEEGVRCIPRAELCNGEDEDCDGAIDEDFDGLGEECSSGLGACRTTGRFECGESMANLLCVFEELEPSVEICD